MGRYRGRSSALAKAVRGLGMEEKEAAYKERINEYTDELKLIHRAKQQSGGSQGRFHPSGLKYHKYNYFTGKYDRIEGAMKKLGYRG